MLLGRFRWSLVLAAFAVVLMTIAADIAEARGRISFGSRGTRTYSAPPPTTKAPTALPIERTVTQPTNPAVTAAPRPTPQATPAVSANPPGFTGGLFGAGLFGLVLGAGLTGGLGSLASFLGLALQTGIIAAFGWALLGLLPGRDRSTTKIPVHNLQPRTRSTFGLRNAAPR